MQMKWRITAPAQWFLKYSPFLMVLIGFGLRLFVITLNHAQLADGLRYLQFGGEPGSIARSVAEGKGFCSPFGGSTGPTAWIGPVYVYLCAAVFKLFGSFTSTSVTLMLCISSAFSALTSAAIYQLGIVTGQRRAGLLGGWSWAVLPQFMAFCTSWIYDASLSALLMTIAIVFAIHLSDDRTLRAWAAYGVFWGFCGLTNPAMLSFFPVSLGWLAFVHMRRRFEYAKRVFIAMLVCLATLSPWLLRNRIVFGEWVFVRSNFAFEFYMGNRIVAPGAAAPHPTDNPAEYQKYKAMGEIAYIDVYRDKAVGYVRDHPGDFARQTVRRFEHVWLGGVFDYLSNLNALPADLIPWALLSLLAFSGLLLAAKYKLAHWFPIAAAIVAFPLPYYVSNLLPRYRHPIEPVMAFMSAYFCWQAVRILREAATRRVPSADRVRVKA